MKHLLLGIALMLSPLRATAAWFCGEEPTEFAQNRSASALSGSVVSPNEITFGRGGQMGWQCEADKDGTQHCRAISMAPPTPEDLTKAVDDYQSRIDAMDSWADTLEDGCLKDAYHNIAAAHRRIIAKDRRAIDFMRTPAPQTTPKPSS